MSASGGFFLLVYIISAIVSFIVALLLLPIMPKSYRQPKKYVLIYLGAFATFVPVLGIIGLVAVVLYLHLFGKEPQDFAVESAPIPRYMPKLKIKKHNLGEGGATFKLRNDFFSVEDRTHALLSMSNSNVQYANYMVQDTFQDNSDELRLMAFNLVDQKEKRINKEIKIVKQRLEEHLSTMEKAKLQKQLAFLNWELIYNDLPEGDYFALVIRRALTYATEAVNMLPNDPMLWVLLGRIYHQADHFEKATEAFLQAEKLGAPASAYIPYLAEVSFSQRKLSEVQFYLRSNEFLRDIPRISPVYQFWCES